MGYDDDEGLSLTGRSGMPFRPFLPYVTYAADQAQTYRAFTGTGTAAFVLTPRPTDCLRRRPAVSLEIPCSWDHWEQHRQHLRPGGEEFQAVRLDALVDGGRQVRRPSRMSKCEAGRIWSSWIPSLGASSGASHRACILTLSGGSTVLKPGAETASSSTVRPAPDPSAGVSLAATGLTAGTLYFVYAYMNSRDRSAGSRHPNHTPQARMGSSRIRW